MSTLVIGASGAIGRACIKALGDERAVVAADLQKPDVGKAHSVSLDVTNQIQVDSVLRELDREEQITGLIYAAGLNTTGLLNTFDWKEYEAVMSVNLRGAFHVGSSKRSSNLEPGPLKIMRADHLQQLFDHLFRLNH